MSRFQHIRLPVAVAVTFLMTVPVSAGDISFHPTIEAAREAEAVVDPANRQPVVLTFGAAWCAWCRKMEVDTFTDEAVGEMAEQFLWVRVDAEEDPVLSARFRVQGLPHTFVLNEDDRVIASRPGFIPPDEFVAFLNDALLNPQPIEDLLYDLLLELADEQSADERRETVTSIVEQMARAERDGRGEALRAMSDSGPDVWSVLVELLDDERLAVRAASAGTLQAIARAELVFDPFAPAEERREQTELWKAWVENSRDAPGADASSEDVGT